LITHGYLHGQKGKVQASKMKLTAIKKVFIKIFHLLIKAVITASKKIILQLTILATLEATLTSLWKEDQLE
jgi:hypothetical protein